MLIHFSHLLHQRFFITLRHAVEIAFPFQILRHLRRWVSQLSQDQSKLDVAHDVRITTLVWSMNSFQYESLTGSLVIPVRSPVSDRSGGRVIPGGFGRLGVSLRLRTPLVFCFLLFFNWRHFIVALRVSRCNTCCFTNLAPPCKVHVWGNTETT